MLFCRGPSPAASRLHDTISQLSATTPCGVSAASTNQLHDPGAGGPPLEQANYNQRVIDYVGWIIPGRT